MQTLNNYFWIKLKYLYLFLGIIFISTISFFSISLIVFFKEKELDSTLKVSAQTTKEALQAGDLSLLQKYIYANILDTSVYKVTIKTNDENIVLGPLVASKFGMYPSCKKTTISSSLIIEGCIKYFSSKELFILISSLLFILSLFSIIFLFVRFKISQLLNEFKKTLDDVSSIESISSSQSSEVLQIQEFTQIYKKINGLISDVQHLEQHKTAIEISKQVAHDIRSPLSVLNIVTSSLQGLEKEQKELVKSSIQRINDIANDLLKKGKPSITTTNEVLESDKLNLEVLLIDPLIDSIITEKRLQFKSKSQISIFSISSHNYGNFVHINSSDFKRILSNLINNSVESIMSRTGEIKVSLESDGINSIIKIIDNGPGIPSHILDKLGHESVSYGKEHTQSGTGLGVLHAKKTIEQMNGQFAITSTLQKGTEVKITLPLAPKPDWFLEKLSIKKNTTILVCDDDYSILALWKKRLSEIPSAGAHYFASLKSLEEFLITNQISDFILLIDFEFTDDQSTGVDFIISNRISSKAFLVSSHYDEPQIIQACYANGFKQIPKNICALIPIEIESEKDLYDAIILDDDDIQTRSWEFAAIQKGKSILVFNSPDEFYSKLSSIDFKTPIFIDAILRNNIKGETIAKHVYNLGFINIYMSSGHDPSVFKHMTFLKGIIGKTPFFP